MAAGSAQFPFIRIVAACLLAACWIGVIIGVWVLPDNAQWDFRVFYHAAQAQKIGLDPYDHDELRALSDVPLNQVFLYPPLSLQLFRPLAELPYTTACRLWLVLKVIVLTALLVLWKRTMLPRFDILLFLGVCLLAFNGATIWDLRSGNVTIIELALMWGAFLFYLGNRPWGFAALIVLAAGLKLIPILLLLLLLLHPKKQASWLLPAGLGVVAFLALTLVPILLLPEGPRNNYFDAIWTDRPAGEFNPSSLVFIQTIVDHRWSPFRSIAYAAEAVWGVYLAVLLVPGLHYLFRLSKTAGPRVVLCASLILYALVMPRFMVYSYMLLIVPCLYLFDQMESRAGTRPLFLVLLCLQGAHPLLPRDLAAILGDHLPYLMALGFWMVFIRFYPHRSHPSQ